MSRLIRILDVDARQGQRCQVVGRGFLELQTGGVHWHLVHLIAFPGVAAGDKCSSRYRDEKKRVSICWSRAWLFICHALLESTATSVPPSPTSLPPTNTVPPATLTPKPTATSVPLACQQVKQSPDDGKTFKPDDNFDAVWTVKNVGSAVWADTDVDYRYKSGDKFHKTEIYDLPETTKPGESVELLVEMNAPDKEGEYKTTWALQRGSNVICTLTLEINVDK